MNQITFQNGLTCILSPTSGTESVTVLILVGAGSRYETIEQSGISHFLEHMFFKGAKKYKNTREVSEAIDAIGGEFNAFTGKEYAGYYVKVTSTHITTAIDVLSDMLLHSHFDPAEIDKERGVILEEYNMYQDTPIYQVGWDFERLLFGDQPLGRDQIGTKKLIRSVSQDDFKNYQKELYTPDNTVISLAGNIPEGTEDLIKKAFPWKGKKAFQFKKYEPKKIKERLFLQEKKTEQGHMILGVPGVNAIDPEYHFVQKVLAMILGGMMSSRMFLSVREQQGLCYSISTSTDDYLDIGALSTYAGVDLTRITDATTAILAEYKKIAEKKVGESELKKAKECLKGKILLRLEGSDELAHFYGKQALLYPKTYTTHEVIESIDRVTSKEVLTLSQKLFQPESFHLSLIGPFQKRIDELRKILEG